MRVCWGRGTHKHLLGRLRWTSEELHLLLTCLSVWEALA